ncbi:hypothetical protein ACE6H2_023519 [Prunus campanulata]
MDKSIWGLSKSSSFFVKSAYLSFIGDADFVSWRWDFLWKLYLPPKLKTFLWLIGHGKILTNVQKEKRRLIANHNCQRYTSSHKTMEHICRGCRHALKVWSYIIIPPAMSHTFSLGFVD